jgi:hypothetical protein
MVFNQGESLNMFASFFFKQRFLFHLFLSFSLKSTFSFNFLLEIVEKLFNLGFSRLVLHLNLFLFNDSFYILNKSFPYFSL